LLYVVATIIPMPERAKAKFFEIVPLYPKSKYAIMLYAAAGIIYGILSMMGARGFLFAILSVIIASQVVRGIAKLRKESLEESQEEEMARKRKNRFG